jgi:nitrous oxidase accessory protein NosD
MKESKTCPCDSMKKLLLLLALILLPLAVSAVNLIDGIYYNLNSDTKTAEVVKYLSKKYSGDFVIPSSVTVEGIKYKVTSVGASAFTGCSDLTSITIPNSVTTIGKEAFEYCRELYLNGYK